MTVTADRAALKGALTPIGLAVLDTERDMLEPPCFVIGNPTGSYAEDFDGDYTRTFPVTLLVGRSDAERAIEFIDPYLDTSGSKSVPAAIRTLPNAAAIGFSNFGGGYTLGDSEYIGVTFEVQLL